MSEESYNKSFRFLEQDWENIYDRPKSSIAEYLRGMCEFAFSSVIPPKSERARFAGYNAVRARVMKGRRDTAIDTAADTPLDTPLDTAVVFRGVPCQEYKNNTSSLKNKTASPARGEPPTIEQFQAMAVKAGVPADFAEYLHGELTRCEWTDADGAYIANPIRYLKSAWNAEQKKIRAARADVGPLGLGGGIQIAR